MPKVKFIQIAYGESQGPDGHYSYQLMALDSEGTVWWRNGDRWTAIESPFVESHQD